MYCKIAVLLVALAGHTQAEVIAIAEMPQGHGVNRLPDDNLSFGFWNWPRIDGVPGAFRENVMSLADIGSTFYFDVDDGEQYRAIARTLTNGEPDEYLISMYAGTRGAGHTIQEHRLFTTVPDDWNGVDLDGYRIDGFHFTLLEYTIASPGSNPGGNGIWTDYRARIRISVEGISIPEPKAGFLLVMAIPLLIRRTLRRRDGPPRSDCRSGTPVPDGIAVGRRAT